MVRRIIGMEKKVSIICSVYNEENYISEMLDSIIAQTYSNWELIIVDDASTDKTKSIIMRYDDDRIKLIENQERLGLTKNLNKAIDISDGEYILRIDGDDIAYEGRIKKQVEYMEKNPDIGLSGGWVRYIGDRFGEGYYDLSNDKLKIMLLFNSVMAHPNMIIRKKVLDNYNIKYDESLQYAQDYDLEYRISKWVKISNIPYVLLKYRIHRSQISISSKEKQEKCASNVRTKILSDLGIYLDDFNMELWNDFCDWKENEFIKKDSVALYSLVKNISKKWNNVNGNDIELIGRWRVNQYLAMFGNKKLSAIDQNRYQHMFEVMGWWTENLQMNRHISQILMSKGYKSVIIYGAGNAGKRLYNELKESVDILGVVDQNIYQSWEWDEIQLYDSKAEIPYADIIIVSAFMFFEQIEKDMYNKSRFGCISLEDLIYETALI